MPKSLTDAISSRKDTYKRIAGIFAIWAGPQALLRKNTSTHSFISKLRGEEKYSTPLDMDQVHVPPLEFGVTAPGDSFSSAVLAEGVQNPPKPVDFDM